MWDFEFVLKNSNHHSLHVLDRIFLQFQECTEEPQEKCEEVEMSVPKQEKQLKKKCLLPDDGANVNAAITARGNSIFP